VILVVVLDNEANKLMLRADSLQASEEKYKLSYYEIEKSLKLLLLVTVLLMTTSGVYSQKQLTSSRQHVLLLQRDSIFCKDSTW
jgi:cell division protein FtsL